MPNPRKKPGLPAVLCLAAVLLAGCLPAPDDGIPAPGGTTVPAAESAAPAGKEGPTAISILLPADKAAFGQALAGLAAADGNTLEVRTLPTGERYTAAALAALAEEAAPDIVWLEGAGALDEFAAEGAPPLENLAGEGLGPLMAGLADLVPEAGRLPLPGAGANSLAGLPLGYYTEGYLVNLKLLAALLGTDDLDGLLDNLYACNWAQWRLLVRSLESYLAQPGRIELRLAAQKYTTPGYRPNGAQALRGIFAVATGDAASITGNAADLIMGLCFSGAAEMRAATAEERRVLLEPVLSSLMGLFELETMHMAQSGGALRRGEGFANYEALSAGQARALFVNGTALFLRADSRTGLKIEQENPELSGKLAMIPIKLPPPSYIIEAETEAEAERRQENGDDATTALPEPESEAAPAQAIPEAVAAELIANSNLGLWVATDGLLCVRAGTGAMGGVTSLLLRLYTTAEGQRLAGESLNLHSFTDIYPAGTLAGQVAAETGPEGWQLVAPPSWLKQPRNEIGGHVQQYLLNLYVWDEERQKAFYTACFAAFGARTTAYAGENTVPDIENGQDTQNSASNP